MGGGHPWSFVKTDLDTLLTALYVLIDDRVIEPGQRRPGRPKRLSDAELVCLAVAQERVARGLLLAGRGRFLPIGGSSA